MAPGGEGAEGGADAGDLRPVSERLLVQRHWEPTRAVPIPEAAGAHAVTRFATGNTSR